MRSIHELVDVNRYAIDRLDSAPGQKLLTECRAAMNDVGICMLPGFLTAAALQQMAEEASEQVDKAFFCDNTHNAYLRADDESLPTNHPGRRQLQTKVGSIANDYLPVNGALVQLYESEHLTRFIGAVLGFTEFYRSADPLGALSINVFQSSGAHAWHFDESRYTVTLMLQPAEHGGEFEAVPNLRSDNDDNFDGVARVLDGDHSDVVRLPFEPGTLFIFAGRHSLHRVTDVVGDNPRLVPVLCYSEKPNAMNSESVRKLFWGRTGVES